MKTMKYSFFAVLSAVAFSLISCEPKAIEPDSIFKNESEIDAIIQDEFGDSEYTIYGLNQFLDTFMTEQGNFWSDTSQYRTRSTNGNGIYLYTVDTLPTDGKGIYIRGRVTTDDFGGNFYKSLVIQQTKDWTTGADIDQENLRISVDLGSAGGMFQLGQEILIRCNGLAVGRYANQPQLCIPTYNNNIYAMSASQKVGWCPGRIPAFRFMAATKMIGMPDQSKLKYDTVTLKKLYTQIAQKPEVTLAGMDAVRKADGRLVVVKGVHFNGKYNDQGEIATCEYDDPDRKDSKANVFAPTTNNVGYPQNRLLEDGNGRMICCSNSEYCKFAYFFIPGADTTGVSKCAMWEGTVTGILGWYVDNATGTKAGTLQNLTGYEWSVTPRGIPGIGVEDIKMYNDHGSTTVEWVPEEWDPKVYQDIQARKQGSSEGE